MDAPILLTGGTGTLGRLVLVRLRAAGQPVRVLSRNSHDPQQGVEYVVGDLAADSGVAAAVAGVDTIVHCAGTPKRDQQIARTLVRAATAAGSRHLVNISVVGADRIPVTGRIDKAMFGYFAAKLAAERVVAESGLPWTTLRATQFHDLVLMVLRAVAKLPVPLPGAAARAVRHGANLAPDRAVGTITWAEFLADHVSPRNAR